MKHQHYTMCKVGLLGIFIALLSGCAAIGGAGATVNDALQADAEFMLCKGISVGSWSRAYGNDAAKAAAWRTLCNNTLPQTPAIPQIFLPGGTITIPTIGVGPTPVTQ